MTLAAVLFADKGAGWWAGRCRPGYRHCEVILFTVRGAVGIGGQLGTIDAEVIGAVTPEAVQEWCDQHGYRLMWTRTASVPRLGMFCLFSCVGVCKAVLGINGPLIWTPWQLARALERRSCNDATSSWDRPRRLWPLPLCRRWLRLRPEP